jgi:hypothetical protein
MSLPPLLPDSDPTEQGWRRKVRDAVNLLMKRFANQGETSERPPNPDRGTQFYDVTLSKPIWWSGTHWKDASGTNV